MSVSLLDVNVLVALHDPSHVHHEAAHRWFSKARRAWATCPLTESGFVRVVSNPKYPTIEATPSEAASRLAELTRAGGHHFWEDGVRITDSKKIRAELIQGHGQIMDIHLLALAVAQRGKLATFDRKINAACVPGGATALEVIG